MNYMNRIQKEWTLANSSREKKRKKKFGIMGQKRKEMSSRGCSRDCRLQPSRWPPTCNWGPAEAQWREKWERGRWLEEKGRLWVEERTRANGILCLMKIQEPKIHVWVVESWDHHPRMQEKDLYQEFIATKFSNSIHDRTFSYILLPL